MPGKKRNRSRYILKGALVKRIGNCTIYLRRNILGTYVCFAYRNDDVAVYGRGCNKFGACRNAYAKLAKVPYDEYWVAIRKIKPISDDYTSAG